MHRDNPLFEKDKLYAHVQSLIMQYKAEKKGGKRIEWIAANPLFRHTLNRLKNRMKRVMFKNALDNVISYLGCIHEIEHHKVDLMQQVNVIVSEFLFHNQSRKGLQKILTKILSKDTAEFPFPAEIAESDEEAKRTFIKNRTFHQQFSGIYNLLQSRAKTKYYLFRVFGLVPLPNFEFTYNKVTFYQPQHPRLSKLLAQSATDKFTQDFFSGNDFMIAVFKCDYMGTEVAANTAISHIESEIAFFNRIFNISCRLNRFAYLYTENFEFFAWHRDHRERSYKLREDDLEKLNDNPFHELRRFSKATKDILLRHEPLFLKALSTKSVEVYWQYLEAIIPSNAKDEKQIIDVVSHLLLLDAEESHKRILGIHFVNTFINGNSELFGITNAEFTSILNKIQAGTNDFEYLSNKIDHPFLQELLSELRRPFSHTEYEIRKKLYERILWETQFQRNGIVHKGQANDKALIALNECLTKIIRRLRVILFNGIRSRVAKTYPEIIVELKLRAASLLQA